MKLNPTAPALYLVALTAEQHVTVLRYRESSRNAGSLTRFNEKTGRTEWTVAGQMVAVSEGPVGTGKGYWAVVHLTPAQHALATDQLSNNEASSDEELIEFFFTEAQIVSGDTKALLFERDRCAIQPMYEPLSETYEP